MLCLEQALKLPSSSTSSVSYLPQPNSVDTVLSNKLAPVSLTVTCFVFAFLDADTLVMTRNRTRGIEVPGGHIEPGEDAVQAAIREMQEETACAITDVRPIGFLRMRSQGSVPMDWKYPHPHGFQQFFSARVSKIFDLVPTEEIADRVFVRYDDVSVLSHSQLVFALEAQHEFTRQNQ